MTIRVSSVGSSSGGRPPLGSGTSHPGRIDCSPALATVRAELLRHRLGQAPPAPVTLSKEEWPPDYNAVYAWRTSELARYELDPAAAEEARRYYAQWEHCADFINHWIDTYDPRRAAKGLPVKIPLVMFTRQEELVSFVLTCLRGEASGLVEKSRDMGATWVCIGVTIWAWLFLGPVSLGWGSQKKEKLDRLGDPSTVFEKLRMAMRALPDCFKPNGFDDSYLTFLRLINPETGASVIGEIGDDIGRSGRTMMYFVDEAAHLKRPEAVEASLLETTRVRIDISSVSGLGTVFHRKREAGRDWEPGKRVTRERTNVFVMDWADHPEKTKKWHDTRKSSMQSSGLGHVFAREIERDYAAAVEGVIIPQDHVRAAIDAHVKLGIDPTGMPSAGLDVADGGADSNALVGRRGILCIHADEWGERDVGVTARRAVGAVSGMAPIDVMYDVNGPGAGVKAEINRLEDDGQLPAGINFVPWWAGGAVLQPYGNVIPDDEKSPRNRDFFQNLKAQAWWQVARKFERTWRAVEEGLEFDPEQLIAISSQIPKAVLSKLMKELSQPVMVRSSSLKLMVDKTPEGMRSPNLGDAFVMAYWPVLVDSSNLGVADFVVGPKIMYDRGV